MSQSQVHCSIYIEPFVCEHEPKRRRQQVPRKSVRVQDILNKFASSLAKYLLPGRTSLRGPPWALSVCAAAAPPPPPACSMILVRPILQPLVDQISSSCQVTCRHAGTAESAAVVLALHLCRSQIAHESESSSSSSSTYFTDPDDARRALPDAALSLGGT